MMGGKERHLIVVTGGAGYIGSYVVRALRDRGDEVLVVDDLRMGHREAVGDTRLLECDIATAKLDWRGVDAVFHFAASTSVEESVRKPDAYWRNNFEAAKHFLSGAIQGGVPRIVYSSTAAVYGEPERVPIRELDPTRPINPYGETKLELERYLLASGVSCAILRYFNAAGGAEDHSPETHLIPLLVSGQGPFSVYGSDYPTPDGTCVRDYIHVEDLARAHLLALGQIGIFNLGSGTGWSVLELVTRAGREPRFEARRPGDPPVLVADITRAQQELGWEPRLGIDDILESAREWRHRHPHGYASA